jgi:antitoxin PrlF
MPKTRVSRRWRTTVPAAVRKALRLEGEDRLVWEIHGNEAIVRRTGAVAEEEHDDPALEPFLRLLASDIDAHPERLIGMPDELYRSLMAIAADVEVGPDETFDGAVCL